MAGIALAQAEAKLAAWMEAEDKVALGQSYTIMGRSLTRADARLIAERINFWNHMVIRLGGGGISVTAVTPIEQR
jgi:hypothetical protein